MPTTTPNLGLTKSDVGGSEDVWGGHLNGNQDIVDGTMDPSTGHTHDGTAGEGPKLGSAALNGPTGDGVIAASGADFVNRTIKGADGVIVTDGDGAAGDPTAALDFTSLVAAVPVSGDLIAIYDVSASLMRRATVAEILQFADATETSAGVLTDKGVTPNSLATSQYGYREFQFVLDDFDAPVSVGSTQFDWVIRKAMEGMDLVDAHVGVRSAGSGADTTFMVRNLTTGQDVLSAPLTLASGQINSSPVSINPARSLATLNDRWSIDVDTVSANAPVGAVVTLTYQKSGT